MTCFRPFPGAQLVETLKDVKAFAVKIIATISGDLFGIDAQTYPKYSSEKTGLPTTYYLTLANEPVRVHSELNLVDFMPLSNENAFLTGNPLVGCARAARF